MQPLVVTQLRCAFGRVFLVLLAALALSGAPAQAAHANSQRLRAPAPPLEFTPHREISGSQLNPFNASLGPALAWNTFLGGSGVDWVNSIVVDANGNIYAVGTSTATWGSPVRPYTSGYDMFAAKLSSSGELLWNTFLGGSGTDRGLGIALDGNGNVYVGGSSSAPWGSPLPGSAYSGPSVAKLNPAGTLVWNTIVGSGMSSGGFVATDKSGSVYVSGTTPVTLGPSVRAYSSGADIHVVKMDSNGTTLWNTVLGGDGFDNGGLMAVDGDGNVYVTGVSDAAWGAPVRDYTAGADTFVAKLDMDGGLIWNTFLGGSGSEIGTGIGLDGAGNAYVSGTSNATWGSPLRAFTNGYDAFVTKLSPNGDLSWNTFLGGGGGDHGAGLVVQESGAIDVAGYGDATWGSPVRPYTSDNDAFAAELSPSGALVWNTFFGGAGADHGSAIAIDRKMNVYVTGDSNAAWGSPHRAYASGEDGFVAQMIPFHLNLPLVTK